MKIAAKLDLRMGGVFTLYPDGLAGNTVLSLRLIAASEGAIKFINDRITILYIIANCSLLLVSAIFHLNYLLIFRIQIS